jgi:carbonic anhydrase/acetyltransferase-like protein (isoleucine patch superfamily)
MPLHQDKQPRIHETAYISPTSVVCGDVIIGENSRVQHGSVIDAGEGSIWIGNSCTVMEQVVIRADRGRSTDVGNHVLIESFSRLVGCAVEDYVIILQGATILPGARVRKRSRIGINSVVSVNVEVPEGKVVPFGHVALGSNPVHVLDAGQRGRIWHLERTSPQDEVVAGKNRRLHAI